MGLFDKAKQFLAGTHAKVSVQLPPIAFPGQPIAVKVTATAAANFDCDGVYLLVGGTESVKIDQSEGPDIHKSESTFSQKFQNFDSSLYMLGWGVATYDAQYMIQSLVRTRTSGADGNFNFSRISDPVVDRLTDAMKSETDVNKRNAMIKEALLRIKDEVLLIPLHHQMRPWAMKASVTTVHRSDDRPEARFTSVR